MPESKIDYKKMLLSNDYADYIVAYRGNIEDFTKDNAELGAEELNEYFGLLHMQDDTNPYNNFSKFGYIGIPKLFTLLDTTSLDASGITQVQSQPYLNLSGEGVIMGFIDTGIDYKLNVFKNAEGKSRILRIWDQTIQTGIPPNDFYYGSEYTQEQIDEALRFEDAYSLVPSKDEDGHGTFLAGVGAGSPDPKNNFIGVAPKCEIAVVKLKQAKQYLRDYYFADPNAQVFQETDIMLAIRYMAHLGEVYNKLVVICIAVGTNQGDHAGNAPIDSMISTLPTLFPNVVGVVAAGNESGKAHHFYGVVEKEEVARDMEILVKPDTPGFTCELWGAAPSIYSISITSPLGEKIPKIAVRLGRVEEIAFVLEKTVVQLVFELVQSTSGAQLIFMHFQDPTQGIWKIQVYCSKCSNIGFHAWLPVSNLLVKDVSYLEPNPDTTITVPGYAISSLTASTYNAYDKSIYLFSGRGFSRIGLIKPDFAAPGVDVQGPSLGQGFTTKSGSSIAAAITAGCVALIWEWGRKRNSPNYFNVQELKVFFIRGALRSNNLTYPNEEWGYGTINIYNVFLSLINF